MYLEVQPDEGEEEAAQVLHQVVEYPQALRVLAVLHVQKGADLGALCVFCVYVRVWACAYVLIFILFCFVLFLFGGLFYLLGGGGEGAPLMFLGGFWGGGHVQEGADRGALFFLCYLIRGCGGILGGAPSVVYMAAVSSQTNTSAPPPPQIKNNTIPQAHPFPSSSTPKTTLDRLSP